jgi:hypothetical protein
MPHDKGELSTMPHDEGGATTMPHDECEPTTIVGSASYIDLKLGKIFT